MAKLRQELPELQRNKADPGEYYVDGQTWQVGARYELLKVLGQGSFSSVCLATDTTTRESVAIKRIPDVLASAEYTRRVLREICILRRLTHPNIIALLDVFLKPASTSKLVYRNGALVSTSVDVYIVMEYAELGDLFHMKGQLSLLDVKAIMWQLLNAVRFLHDNGVWHRDIKSANVLMSGWRSIKLADFGLARSASSEGYQTAEQQAAIPPQRSAPIPLNPTKQHEAFIIDGSASLTMEDLYAQPNLEGGGFRAPLTRVVCTPCYRAPEVVLSRGGYTSALDMWSVGCVFGELLQRVAYLGKASTPHLQVAPVFAIHGFPKTPNEGDKFLGDAGNPTTRHELDALFDVIGTPAWACIDAVPECAWRSYLRHLPARAPKLFRRFGSAGEPAVDLLARLLTFDPRRRCTAAEALTHEFFEDLLEDGYHDEMEPLFQTITLSPQGLAASTIGCSGMEVDEGGRPEKRLRQEEPQEEALDAAQQAALALEGAMRDATEALAALEKEMADCCASNAGARLRELLEAEVALHSTARSCPTSPVPHTSPMHEPRRMHSFTGFSHLQWEHLKVDPGQDVDPSVIGFERLPHHADTIQANVEPEKHLRAGRHGEWAPTSLAAGTRVGPVWGVSTTPPGMDHGEATPEMMRVISEQNKR